MDSDGIRDAVNGADKGRTAKQPSSSLLVPLKHADLGQSSRSTKKIPRKVFINALNYLHFTGGQAFVRVIFRLTGEEFLLKVHPGPCIEDVVSLSLMTDTPVDLEGFEPKSLVVDDGQSVMSIPLESIRLSGSTFSARLDVKGIMYTARNARRFQSPLVDAAIRQGSARISGCLVDFTSSGLRIRFNENLGVVKASLSLDKEITVSLCNQGQVVFSGDCLYVRDEPGDDSMILKPTKSQQARFKERKLRNPRLCLVPTPKISFIHPFSYRRVSYEVSDITNSGFSVQEASDKGQLIPGMIIPELTILYSGGLKLECSAQVVYTRKLKKNMHKHGFAIYDMDLVTYNQFFDIYSNAIDRHANVTREVNMDALWEFFFQSGFIYPKKYETLSDYKDDFKKTYEKLYRNSPEIFANFTYQSNGNIFGHVSWIKAYNRTWMIHHLAAKPMGRKRVGLYVLNHVMYCFDGFCRLPSTGMDHMIFYFRPENKFPDYFFGGFCREHKNPKGCSMDCFAYLKCVPSQQQNPLPEGWTVEGCSQEDIDSLRSWYERNSGGLMIDAFCLDKGGAMKDSVADLYGKYGLLRKYRAFVLKHNGMANAYLIADESDMGVNLSEFLNSIKIIVTGNDLPWSILHASLGRFVDVYGDKVIALLVYPYSYLEEQGVTYNNKYNLWVLSAQSGDDYTESLKRMAKFRLGKFFIHYLRTKLGWK